MKKIVVTALMGLSCHIFAQIPSSGLIGRWEFNGPTNTFLDGSPSNNHALVAFPNHGPFLPTLTTDRCGSSNSAVNFNGINQFLEMPIQNGPIWNNARSVSFWMKTTNILSGLSNNGSSKAIFSYGQISNAGGPPLGGVWEVDHNYSTNGAGIDVSNEAFTAPTTCLTDGTWHHVVAIVPTPTSAVTNYSQTILYFDGVLQLPVNYTQVLGLTQALQTLNSSILIGCNQQVPHQRYYEGDLDDVYFYNRELSYSEVLQLLNTNCGITANPCWCNFSNTFTTPQVAGAVSYAWSTSPNVTILSTPPYGNAINVSTTGGAAAATVTITTASCGYIIRSFSLPYTECNPNSINLMATPSAATFCANVNSGVTLSASSSFIGPITYVWTPGPLVGPSVFVSPSATQIYQVTAYTQDFCPATINVLVTVENNCCPTAPLGTQTLTSLNGNYGPGTYIITNNIILGANTTFSGAEFLMADNVKITVPPTLNLHLDGSHLYACGLKMWQGIEILDGGYITTTPLNVASPVSSLIEDAIIAIDLSHISPSFHNPPIDVQNTTFNKNYIGIKISDAQPLVNTVPISLLGCVFTSRALPFSSSIWPSADQSDLRQTNAVAMANLPSPFQVGGFVSANLKLPYNNQSAMYGIKIEDIGNTPGIGTSVGIDIGLTYQGAAANNSSSDFNLFDNLGVGIDVTDASLTTMNNIFQNMIYSSSISGMSGCGIRQKAQNHIFPPPGNQNMNARLDLRPIGIGNQSNAFGNRFWNCKIGIHTTNIYEVNVEYGVFRTTQTTNLPSLQPKRAILLESNRFDYNIRYSEFNNIAYGITINSNPGFFNVNSSGIQNGIYPGNIIIEQNYFGAHVNSLTNLNNGEYLGDAIHLNGPNLPVYFNGTGGAASITSNKIDRAYRGISLNSMYDYPVNIQGNKVLIVDNILAPFTRQYGIEAQDNAGNLVITDNDLSSINTTNINSVLVYCKDNTGTNVNLGMGSPIVNCNATSTSYTGFEFEGNNSNANWMGNVMQNHEYGFVLTANGVIGQQGNSSFASNNQWLGAGWNSPGWQTFCNSSNANLSPLYVLGGSSFDPAANGGGLTPYVNGPGSVNLIKVNRGQGFQCQNVNYPALPTQRIGLFGTEYGAIATDVYSEGQLEIFPNPSSGNLTLSSASDKQTLIIRIVDITGKLVYSKTLSENDSKTIDISSLKASLYLIEIENESGQIVRKKLVKE